jgi:protein-L-isoaspartate(D-aspartate) O-methyltransferase
MNHNFTQKKSKLIRELEEKGITNQDILKAIQKIPRELFLSKSFWNRAYEDNALPIDCGQTISQPFTVAYMTQLLDVEKGMRVLEIGTGSGYQALLLYFLKTNVYTIERHEPLYQKAKLFFEHNKLHISCHHGDGTKGLLKHAPYDRIIVTAASPDVPEELLKQLDDNGKLVIPIGTPDSQIMHLITKQNNEFDVKQMGKFKFVPLIGEDGFRE